MPVGDGANNNYANYVKNSRVVLTGVIKNSPAEKAGLAQGDQLLTVDSITGANLNTTKIRSLIEGSATRTINVIYSQAGVTKNATVTPELNKVAGKLAIGIYMQDVGVVKLNPVLALWEGAKLTVTTIKEVAVGLAKFIWQAIRGHGDFSQVSGPVGIVNLVGDAAHFGLAYFLGFVAFISLNLAVINLIPFPALDGGRLLFLLIEKIKGSRINPKIANTVNMIGFGLLMVLMVIITYHDIVKLI